MKSKQNGLLKVNLGHTGKTSNETKGVYIPSPYDNSNSWFCIWDCYLG